MHYTYAASPLGPILVAGDAAGLRHVGFQAADGARRPDPAWVLAEEPLRDVVDQLGAYFAGERRAFDLRLAPGGTPFQRAVWAALSAIPYGETMSYGELARRLGHPTAARAVGAANGQNPIPIVVPCHRLVGGDGSLTGFRGGVHLKRHLLALERRVAGEPPVRSPARPAARPAPPR